MPPFRPNLATLLQDFDRHGKQIAIVARRGVRQRRLGFHQLATLARRFAAELEDRGIVKGDRLVLWGENSPEWTAAFFGCILRGVLPVPVDVGSSEDFVHRVVAAVSPKLILMGAGQLGTFSDTETTLALEELPGSITQRAAEAVELVESDP